MSDQADIRRLIEQSSLGTQKAQAMRKSVSPEKGRAMVRAAATRNTVTMNLRKKSK